MTWALVKPVLIDIVEGTRMPTVPRIGARRFLYEGKKGTSSDRTFGIEITGEEITNVFMRMTNAKVRTSFDIVIRYQNDNKGDDVGDVMAADYMMIAKRLNEPSNWQRDTSTVLHVDLPLPQFKKTVERSEGYAVMRIACAILHKD